MRAFPKHLLVVAALVGPAAIALNESQDVTSVAHGDSWSGLYRAHDPFGHHRHETHFRYHRHGGGRAFWHPGHYPSKRQHAMARRGPVPVRRRQLERNWHRAERLRLLRLQEQQQQLIANKESAAETPAPAKKPKVRHILVGEQTAKRTAPNPPASTPRNGATGDD